MRYGAWMIVLLVGWWAAPLRAAPAGTVPAGTTVLLLPLENLTPAEDREWIGRAVQQTVLSELGQVRIVHPVTPAKAEPGAGLDVGAAREAGRQAGVTLVVFGSYQIVEENVRLAGQVLDVESGKLLGGMKATGELRDLFGLQDSIAEQTKQIVAVYALARVPATTQPAQQQVQGQPQGVQVTPAPPADLSYFDRHNVYLDDYDRYDRRYYDYDDYLSSQYRYRYSPYYPYPYYPPVIVVPPPLNNPPHVRGPANIGGTISIGGSRGSGYRPPTMGRSIGK